MRVASCNITRIKNLQYVRVISTPTRRPLILTSQSVAVLTVYPSRGTWVKAWTPLSPGLATVVFPMLSTLTACNMNWLIYLPPPLDSSVTTIIQKQYSFTWLNFSAFVIWSLQYIQEFCTSFQHIHVPVLLLT